MPEMFKECCSVEEIETFLKTIPSCGGWRLFRGTGNLHRPVTDSVSSVQRPLNVKLDHILTTWQKELLDGWLGDMPNSFEAFGHYLAVARGMLSSDWWTADSMPYERKMRCVQQMGFSSYFLDVTKDVRIATYFATSNQNDEDCGIYIWDVDQKDIVLHTDPVLEQSAKISMSGLINQETTITPLSSAVVVSVDGDELSWEKAQKSAYIFTPRTYTSSTISPQKVYVHGKCVDMMLPHAFIRIPGAAKTSIRSSLGLSDSYIYPGSISKCLTSLETEYPGVMQRVVHSIKRAIDEQVVKCDE